MKKILALIVLVLSTLTMSAQYSMFVRMTDSTTLEIPVANIVDVTWGIHIHVTSVTLDKDAASLEVGESITLSALVNPSDATDKTVTWSTSDTTVATVSDGVVTAVKLGNAIITAVAEGKVASCTITVVPTPVSSVTLNMETTTLSPGESTTLTATVSPSNATYKSVAWSTSDSTVATVTDGVVKAVKVGTATISATAHGQTANCVVKVVTMHNGYEYVDLGLSVKWATFNVGATAPEEYGNYFAWGETSPKSNYSWDTYKYYKSETVVEDGFEVTYSGITKYATKSKPGLRGTYDGITQLQPEDDAARANWGGNWRMATYTEWKELNDNCTWSWCSYKGINGYKVQSKKTGYTDKWIFLPAAGYRSTTGLGNVGSNGNYWSSSLLSDSPDVARGFYFGSSYHYTGNGYRHYGLSVRPVCQ